MNIRNVIIFPFNSLRLYQVYSNSATWYYFVSRISYERVTLIRSAVFLYSEYTW